MDELEAGDDKRPFEHRFQPGRTSGTACPTFFYYGFSMAAIEAS